MTKLWKNMIISLHEIFDFSRSISIHVSMIYECDGDSYYASNFFTEFHFLRFKQKKRQKLLNIAWHRLWMKIEFFYMEWVFKLRIYHHGIWNGPQFNITSECLINLCLFKWKKKNKNYRQKSMFVLHEKH